MLSKYIADLDLAVWGPGWEKFDFYSPLKKCVKYAGDIKPDLWLKIYAAARVIIIVHYQNWKIPCYQVSPKVYEALACKRPVIVDSQMDLYDNFENNKHLMIFNDISQLREETAYLLENPDKAEVMAQAGYEAVKKEHCYKHRIEKIIDIVFKGD